MAGLDEAGPGVGPPPAVRRILSLDGGGIRGVYSAAFLAGLERHTVKSIADHFDLIVGTSTGGIIATALGLGLPASEILGFYERWGPQIFLTSRWRRMAHLLRPKHEQAVLRRALHEVLGERTFGESRNRLVIVSYDGSRGGVHLLKTRHDKRFHRDHQRRAVDICLATSAAPTYLRASQDDGLCEIDGGVWANCPALVGVVEAVAVLGWSRATLRVLSVGTTRPAFHVPASTRTSGVFGWLRGNVLVSLLGEAQVSGALAQAALLVGKANLMRIDDTVAPGRFSLDDSGAIGDLRALGDQAARHTEPDVARIFLEGTVDPFVPVP